MEELSWFEKVVKLRVWYLSRYYNFLMNKRPKDKFTKREINDVRSELMGYGVIMLRRNRKCTTVTLPDGTIDKSFVIDGTIKTAMGDIIGYNCTNCGQVASVKKWKDYFRIVMAEWDMMQCQTCGGYEIEPIYDDYIWDR